MDIWAYHPYQKNQAHELIECTRPRNDATLSPGLYERGNI
jgi:hypothetical protein